MTLTKQDLNLPLDAVRWKAEQAWELAGLARMDGDIKDAARWTARAKELDQLAKELTQ